MMDLKQTKSEQGFTLPEVLVVILIISVLAAIAVPSYLGLRRSADIAALKSDITQTVIAVSDSYRASANNQYGSGNYPTQSKFSQMIVVTTNTKNEISLWYDGDITSSKTNACVQGIHPFDSKPVSTSADKEAWNYNMNTKQLTQGTCVSTNPSFRQ